MKKTIKIAAIFFAMALVLAGCKADPDDDDDDDKLSAPKVGSVKDIDWAGGTVPATEAAAVELYNDSSSVMGDILDNQLTANASIRMSMTASRPVLAIMEEVDDDDDQNIDENYPIDIEQSVGGGTIKFTGNVREKMSYSQIDEQNLKKSTTYPIMTISEDANVDGTISNVTVEDDGERYTFNGKTKNDANIAMNLSLKTGSKEDLSDSTFKVSGTYGFAFGNAYSVKREKDGAGAKFILTYAANYGPKSWVFDINENSEASKAFSTELTDYLQNQKATLSVYDENNTLKYEIKLTGDEALNTSILYSL